MNKKNMNKKGFTLIELLAVIVILAIIALIATPIILNMINDARKSASVDSAYGYIEAVEYNNSMSMLDSKKYPKIEDGENIDIKTIVDKVKLKGTRPSSGTITVKKGLITQASLCINNYNIEYDGKEAKVIKSSNCHSGSTDSDTPIVNEDDTFYNDGTIIYYDPVENKKCTTYVEDNSKTDVKVGCMKWYAFGDKENGEYKLKIILDHNTTNTCSITDDTTSTPPADNIDTVINSLKNDSKWSITPRMISMEELTTIMGLEYSSATNADYTNLNNNYSWIIPINDNIYGYWTSTEYNSDTNKQWYISIIPQISVEKKNYGRYGIGFRPVVTIDKSIIKD